MMAISKTLRAVVLATVGSAAIAQSALAQQASPTQTAAAEADVEELVVTGSRLRRALADTNTPTVSFGGADFDNAGAVSPGDVLRQLPALAPGVGGDTTGVTFNGAGLDLIDLRNLGTNRTLVLINGRRQVGSNPNTTSVDTNTIPAPLIERVDVITGGASAAYGADAVSGVVNFVLKRNFEGLQIDGQGGISSRGDAERYSLSALAGANFADGRGNVTAFVGYTKEGDVPWDARPAGVSGLNYIPNPANTGPRDGIPDFVVAPNIRQLGGQRESMFLLNPGGGTRAFGFNADGSVRNFALGPSGLLPGNLTDGGEATLGFDPQCPQNECILRVPLERFVVSANARFEVNANLELFMESRYTSTKSSSRFGSVFEIPPTTNRISIDNPFVSDSLRTLMQQANVTSIGIIRSDQELGPRGQDTSRNVLQVNAGARGELGLGDFRYEAVFQYGRTDFSNTRVNDLYQQRWLNAIDAVTGPGGTIQCRSDAARAEGCVPINLLQPGAAFSGAALNYVRIPFATETAELTQTVATGIVNGTIGDFWGAGAISVAGGLEYRKEKSRYLTSPIDQQGQGFFFTRRLATEGQFDVFEWFVEALVPIITDKPFFHRLEVEGAIRGSNYSTSGNTTSWNVRGTWAPTKDFRFRGALARAVRAPNVGELFSPASEGFITVDDPCDVNFRSGGSPSRGANCTALGVPNGFVSNARTINIRTATAGNPTLSVEKADTLTLGAAFTPSFIPGLSATVDYYRIEIADAINVFGAQDILNNCVDLDSISNNFCSSITRAPGGDILQIRRQQINVSQLRRTGVDFALNYAVDLESAGQLNLGLVGTRTLAVETVVAPGTVTGSAILDQNGEFGFPKWKGRFSANWQLEKLSVTGTLNYLSNMVRDVQPVQPEDNRATLGSGNFFLFNLQAAYQLTDKIRFFAGMDNVFDRLPPALPDTRLGGGGSAAGAEVFPITGRFMYAGFRVNL
jgi:iron complex outermembrane recepter protein